MSENRALRRIFGPKRGEVADDWRRLHNEELRSLHSSLDIIVIIKMKEFEMGHVACMGKKRTTYRILV
jgi:hypothetical protein